MKMQADGSFVALRVDAPDAHAQVQAPTPTRRRTDTDVPGSTCAYASVRGECQNPCSPGLYCANHTCPMPGCTLAKRTNDSCCSTCSVHGKAPIPTPAARRVLTAKETLLARTATSNTAKLLKAAQQAEQNQHYATPLGTTPFDTTCTLRRAKYPVLPHLLLHTSRVVLIIKCVLPY